MAPPVSAPAPAGRLRAVAAAHRDELVLAGLALLLFLPGLCWGLPAATDAVRPRSWAIDAITPMGPVTDLAAVWDAGRDYGYTAYPLLHYLVLAAVFAPYRLFLRATGGLGEATWAFPHGFADPARALIVQEVLGRLVSVAMATGIVLAAYATARTLWGRTAGRAAGAMVLLMYPLTYYSRTGNLDVPALFWTALGLLTAARILVSGVSLGRFALLGVYTALATGTKEQAWGAFALLPPLLLWLMVRRAKEAGRFDWRPAAAGIAACGAVYAVAGGLALNPWRWVAHVRWLRDHVPFPMADNAPPTLAGYATLLGWTAGHVVDAVGPLVLAAALVGVVAAARAPAERLSLALLLAVAGHFLLVLVPVRLSLLRYVMPMAYVACLFAGRGFATGFAAARPVGRRVGQAAFAAACAWGLLLSADLTWQSVNDSRYAVARQLEPMLADADTVASVVSASQLPPLPAGVTYAFIGRDSASPGRVEDLRPPFIIVQPDWTSPPGLPHPRGFPASLYAALGDGSLGYRRVAVFRSGGLFTRQRLDYPTVNPLVTLFVRADRLGARP